MVCQVFVLQFQRQPIWLLSYARLTLEFKLLVNLLTLFLANLCLICLHKLSCCLANFLGFCFICSQLCIGEKGWPQFHCTLMYFVSRFHPLKGHTTFLTLPITQILLINCTVGSLQNNMDGNDCDFVQDHGYQHPW